MTEPSSPNDLLKDAWRSQPVEQIKMTTLELTATAARFERKIHHRNLVEYVAGAVAALVFGAQATFGHVGWIVRLGDVMAVLGVVFIVWQLHRRGSPGRAPNEGSTESLIAFQRAQLVRQRDALRAVPVWYILPVVPSFVVICLGRWVQDHTPGRSLQDDHAMIVVGGVIVALVLVIVWLLNALGVMKLEREIDKIDRLRGP